ncbi:MAG: hypothetical protein V4553_17620 [Bacteroidota bacterium]
MSERSTNENNYPFYWLDEVIEVTLNPDKNQPDTISLEELCAIRERLPEEINRINSCLKNQAFWLYCSDQIKVAAGHYDLAVRVLQKQAIVNLSSYPESGPLRQLGELVLEGLTELSQYLYKRYFAYLPPPAENDDVLMPDPVGKVLCALSADQLGILLRAATDVGILISDSFRKVCKAVAPFLSTPWKTDIKADTLRSHGSRPETRDREIAIGFLEKMIEKIKGYR